MGTGDGEPIVPGLLYTMGDGVPGDMGVLDGEYGAGDLAGLDRGAYGVGVGMLGDSVGEGGLP